MLCSGERRHVGLAEIILPLKDRAAYERACAACNAVMDEHQAREDARNVRRRARRA